LLLGNGEFTFTLGNLAIGSAHVVTAGNSWTLFEADFSIAAPGTFQLGIRNTLASPYFINYDAFAIQPVPEPSTLVLALAAIVGSVFSAFRVRPFAATRGGVASPSPK